MVDTPFDPIRPPSINQSAEELDLMQAMIDEGKLPKNFMERHFDAVDANVFGVDAPKDRKGFRLEQGIGSPNNQTANSLAAYRKFHGPNGPDPDPPEVFEATEKRMIAELAKTNEAKRAKIPANRRRGAGRPN